MAAPPLELHVLCSNPAEARKWEPLTAAYQGLEVDRAVTTCAMESIRRFSQSADRPFLVCQHTTWLGQGIVAQVEALLAELNARFPNWALCGNRGISWDGRLHDYSHDIVSGGLQTSVCAHPVITLGDDALLVNPAVFNRHKNLAPALQQRRPAIPLSLECLLNGSVMAVSPRLTAVRSADSEMESEVSLDAEPDFRAYYRKFFLNHHLATTDGTLDLSEVVDYRYVSDPRASVTQQDVLDLYDKSLEPSRALALPSITICCRTQFRRSEMLERAVLSFAAFRQHAGRLARVDVRLITDALPEVSSPAVERLQQVHPGAGLECWYHTVRAPRYSRTDLLLAAIEQAGTDYIWFVDDDDYVNAPLAPALARCLVVNAPLLIVASAGVMQEAWSDGAGPASGRALLQAERAASYQAAHLFKVLRGRNFIPNCGMIFPRALMQERISKVRSLADYNEDYFLLLLALTAPRVEVCLLDYELASVSLRGAENTVTQQDRTGWNLSLATVLLEMMNHTEGNSPFLWQLANAPRW